MARSEMVEKYQGLVEKYDLLRQRMTKANEQKDKFKSSVVERVLADYERQLKELEDELAPSEDEMFRLVSDLEAERTRVESEKVSLDERRDEIELRNLIGEFEDGEYEVRSQELATELEGVSSRLAAIDEELQSYRELLTRAGAQERRKEAAKPAAPAPAPVEEPIPVRVPSSPSIDLGLMPELHHTPAPAPAPTTIAQPAPAPVFSEPPAVAAPVAPPSTISEPSHADLPLWGSSTPASGPHLLSPGLSDSAFGDAFGSPNRPSDLGGGNAFEMILDDFPMSHDANLGQELPPLGGTGMDELQNLTELDNRWPKDLGDSFPRSSGFHDVLDSGPSGALDNGFGNLDFPGAAGDLPPLGISPSAQPRAAYLIRNFNRPDEDRYEIRDDVTSIGRGRDNQIQIKDDTKVSRYHCRILREPTGYYVEDNNSSNGTMVNGELITRRKVDGGEDVTIGETVFRFLLR